MPDESFDHLVSIEDQATCLEAKVTEIIKEINELCNGHLEKKPYQEASKSIQRRGKCLNEDLQKLLESLDAVQLLHWRINWRPE